jgi:hypothetical protein
MARVSGGVFTPVRDPKDVRAIFEEVSFSDIEKLEVRNKTTGSLASQLISNADGSFSALVDMKEGENTIEAYARSTDGTEGRREVVVKFLTSAATQELSPRMVAQRNRLLENRLLELQRRRVEIQAEANEDVRRELEVEIEKERAKANEAAEKTRRELEVNVDRADPPAGTAKPPNAPSP